MTRFLLFWVCLLIIGHKAQAQRSAYRPVAADVNGSAAQGCAETRLRTSARQELTTPVHRRLMDRYDVKYYKLDLALENNARTVGGSVRLLARAGGQMLDVLAFELHPALLLDSVLVNGRRTPAPRRESGDVSVPLPQAVAANALFEAVIYYHGTAPNGSSAAIGNALDTRYVPRYDLNVTWSLSEPFHAYEWWPCKQVLTDKADSTDVWITTRNPNKVGSNGVLARVVPLPDNRSRYQWRSRHPIAYYLVSVAVAPYLEYVNFANLPGGVRVPIVNYVYNQAALNDFRTEIDRTPAFLENYSALVGPYPFANEKYGHSMAPIGGGMEHQTMTTQDGFNFTLTAHELFHQWFGDNVTCASWEDIWLNEGFASYGEYLSLRALASPEAARQWLDQAHEQVQFRIDRVNGNRIETPGGSVRVPDTTSVGRIFDQRLSYKKGAAVVHMLRYLLHDDIKFFRALRTFQTTYSGRTARTTDLQRVFEAEAGRSLAGFFEQWYAGEGYPTFSVRWNQVGGNLLLQTTETTSMPSVTPFFETELDYKITFDTGSSQVVRLRQSQLVTAFGVPVAGTVTGIELDPDQWVLNATGPITRNAALVDIGSESRTLANVSAFPNPCRDFLALADLPGPVEALVMDAVGRQVLRQNLSPAANQLNTRPLASGLYHLLLISATGEQKRLRFVRE
ncbi:Peptidase M1 membrane alanine aminopeptidase [Hymenobacter roseosalivarius DSM 11622]|uniref:Aminopeptidase N n=1 Tax=Hymenobacter roseosalivarius DSM 11622 TaxID=645990 RepID=A0A1W1W3F1_9BACT|nr:M1 family metallopeptidase [Hymenobacter roseosalivarius]SMC00149.1 Peptidase M1 membrane alanine aminopeptidase [Hymenobacter roseosalivarius DSM 11622]